MNAYAYVRVSGLGQADKDGPVRQMCEIRTFASANKINLAGDFSDVITGEADAGDRPGWVAMVTAIRRLNEEDARLPEGLRGTIRVDCIIAENMTRLGRDMVTTENLVRDCRKHGIKLFIPSFGTQDIATMDNDPGRVFCRQVMAAVAQMEKNTQVFRMRAARERIRASGRRCEGTRPYGELPGELEVMQIAAELHNVHGKSYAEVAKLLNYTKHRTRTGLKWKRSHVIHILNRGKVEVS